jgi:hypothetical protein
VGRVPCLTTIEGANFVEKVLAYEQNPGGGDHAYIYRAFYEYADIYQGWHSCETLMTHDDPSISVTKWGEIPSYDDSNPTFPWDYHVVNLLNATLFHIITTHCHGSTSLYWPLSHGSGDSAVSGSTFGLDDVAALSNEDHYFFWYSPSCENGRLDAPLGIRSLAEAATCIYPLRGAVVFSGNTRLGWWDDSFELQLHA